MNFTPLLPTADPESLGFSPTRLARLTATIHREIGAGKLPGAVAMISRRGQLAYFEAMGKLDPAGDEPMARDSLFRIYSMTKPIVSVAILMMVEQGRLLLNQPLSAYMPGFANLQVVGAQDGLTETAPATRPITIHDLLRHTAGFTYQFMGTGPLHQQYAAAGMFSRGQSNAELCNTLAGFPLLHSPGRVWAYSHATDVLGRLVEILCGRSLGAHLKESIFDPLGMTETFFSVPEDQHHRIAEPFALDPDAGVPINLFDVRQPARQEMGGAGLVSTAADYARFMQAMLDGGALGDVRLLSPSSVRLMTSDHLGNIPATGDLLPPGHGFGLGFAVRLADGLAPGSGHAGQYYWAGLAGTSFFIDPQAELHAQFMIQQPGRRDYYRALFRELVYAALVA